MKLVVVGTPIGNLSDFSARGLQALQEADVIACEDTRRTRALLSHFEISGKKLVSAHEHNERQSAARLVEQAREGFKVAYVTDSGMPGISDPGAEVVAAFVEANIPIEVVPGPTALTTALSVSGIRADRFVFEGFLPPKGSKRNARIAAIAEEARPVVLYESPHRIPRTLRDLRKACGDREIVVCRELTKKFEQVWRGKLSDALEQFSSPRGEFVLVLSPTTSSI